MIESLKTSFFSQSKRDQTLLILLGLAMGVTLIYLLLIDPLFNELATRRDNVHNKENTLLWMQQSALKIRQRDDKGKAVQSNEASYVLLDKTIRQANLQNTVQRVESAPGTARGARANFKSIPFNQLLSLMVTLQQSYNLRVTHVTLREQETGLVDAQVTWDRS